MAIALNDVEPLPRVLPDRVLSLCMGRNSMLHSLSISHLPASFKNSILISIAKCPRLLPGLSTAYPRKVSVNSPSRHSYLITINSYIITIDRTLAQTALKAVSNSIVDNFFVDSRNVWPDLSTCRNSNIYSHISCITGVIFDIAIKLHHNLAH